MCVSLSESVYTYYMWKAPRGVRASEYCVRGVPFAEMLKFPLTLKLPYPPAPVTEGRRPAVADPCASVERFCFAPAGARTSKAPPVTDLSLMPDLSFVTGERRCCCRFEGGRPDTGLMRFTCHEPNTRTFTLVPSVACPITLLWGLGPQDSGVGVRPKSMGAGMRVQRGGSRPRAGAVLASSRVCFRGIRIQSHMEAGGRERQGCGGTAHCCVVERGASAWL